MPAQQLASSHIPVSRNAETIRESFVLALMTALLTPQARPKAVLLGT